MNRISPLHAPLLRAAIALVLSSALAAPAHAAEPPPAPAAQDEDEAPEPPPAQDPKTLSTVNVVGEKYDARRDDTAAKIVVDREELLRHGDTTLADALKRLPGVTIGGGAPGRGGRASLRGLGGGYTQLLVNGQKMPPGFDLESLPPEMVERIEIVRAATADVRTESIAGTINIILSKAARTDARELRLGAGVANGRPSGNASWHQSRRGEFRNSTLNASVHRREFLVDETGTETGVDGAGTPNLARATQLRVAGQRDALSVAPALNLTLEGGDTLSLQAFLDAARGTREGDIAWTTTLGPELRHVRYDQRTATDFAQARADASWTHEFERAGKLATKLSVLAGSDRVDFRELGEAPDGTPNLDDHTRTRTRARSVNSTGKLSLPSFAAGHAVELGWEGSVEGQAESRLQRIRVEAEPERTSDLDFDAQVRRLAAYAQDDWTVAPHWSVYLGARWERIETTSEGNTFARLRHRADVLSPIVQSLWKLRGDRRDQVRAGLSRTYRSVSPGQLVPRPMTSTNNRPLDPDEMGNPALRPELALGLDVAWEQYADDGAMLSLGGYVRRIEGIIRSETSLVGERWVSMPVNGGDALAWGLEMDTKFALPRLIDGAPPIDLRFNLNRNWSRVDDVPGPGNRLGSQVELSSTLSADYRLGRTWTVGGSFGYRTGGTVRTSTAESQFSSPRRDVDAYALARLTPKAKLRLSVGNLLGQEDVSGSTFSDADGTVRLERRRDTPVGVRANFEVKL